MEGRYSVLQVEIVLGQVEYVRYLEQTTSGGRFGHIGPPGNPTCHAR